MIPLVGWACSFWREDWNAEIYFTCPADCTLCSGVQAGKLCVQGSCSPRHVHLQHPCDYHRHPGASKTQVTYICYLGQALGYMEGGQASQLPGHLRSARGPYLLRANSSCGLCCRPAWSWCVVVLMNVAITYILKFFFFYVFLKFCLNIFKKAMADKSAPSVDIVLYNCIY